MKRDGEQQAMTSERLQEIREWLTWAPDVAQTAESHMQAKANRFLVEAVAEVERQQAFIERLNAHRVAVIRDHEAYEAELLADNERLRAMVSAVAWVDLVYPDLTPEETRYLCPFCAGNDSTTCTGFVHTKHCLITEARAVLASEQEPATPSDGERHGRFQYIASWGRWAYVQRCEDAQDCDALCVELSQQYGVSAWADDMGGGYMPAIRPTASNTRVIRAIDASKQGEE